MPSYIAYTDLQNYTGSTLSQTILEQIIDFAEAELALLLTEYGGTADTSDTGLQYAVMLLSVSGLMTRMRMDGSKPSALNLGDMAMNDNIDLAKTELEAKARMIVKGYCIGSPYADTDADFEDTLVRQDHKMSDMQMDQSSVPAYHDEADAYNLQDDEEV